LLPSPPLLSPAGNTADHPTGHGKRRRLQTTYTPLASRNGLSVAHRIGLWMARTCATDSGEPDGVMSATREDWIWIWPTFREQVGARVMWRGGRVCVAKTAVTWSGSGPWVRASSSWRSTLTTHEQRNGEPETQLNNDKPEPATSSDPNRQTHQGPELQTRKDGPDPHTPTMKD
jgi:hypothetical protein